MDNRPVGVFDSGIGGLSILRELQALMPNENYVFFADQHNVPYGEKAPHQLKQLTGRIASFLLSKKVKLIVVACNTATCYAIDDLRTKFPVTFVGTVPAIKPATLKTRTKTIAVISTPATARSPSLKKLVRQFAKGVKVLRIGCAGLEDAVEFGSTDTPETLELLRTYLARAQKAGCDQVVLGCTHYPFLKDSIRSIVGPSITLIDSGKAIARHTRALLKLEHKINTSPSPGTTAYFTNGDALKFSRVATKLLNKRIVGKHARI